MKQIDKIKQKNVEKMVEFFSAFLPACDACAYRGLSCHRFNGLNYVRIRDCKEGIKAWLESEVEE